MEQVAFSVQNKAAFRTGLEADVYTVHEFTIGQGAGQGSTSEQSETGGLLSLHEEFELDVLLVGSSSSSAPAPPSSPGSTPLI